MKRRSVPAGDRANQDDALKRPESDWSSRMDVMVLLMQTPQAAKGWDRLMNATVGELADAFKHQSRGKASRDRRYQEVGKLLDFATQVLGSAEMAKKWMGRRTKMLDGKEPEHFVHTFRGRARVRRVLESLRKRSKSRRQAA